MSKLFTLFHEMQNKDMKVHLVLHEGLSTGEPFDNSSPKVTAVAQALRDILQSSFSPGMKDLDEITSGLYENI